MEKQHKVRITVRLDTRLLEEIRRRAKLAHMTMSAFVEKTLEEYLASKEQL